MFLKIFLAAYMKWSLHDLQEFLRLDFWRESSWEN